MHNTTPVTLCESSDISCTIHLLNTPSSLQRNEIPEMVAHLKPLNSGFPLTDTSDPRYQYITALRRRFGEFLHRASGSLLQQGEQNTLDAVMMLVRSFYSKCLTRMTYRH
jgi:hypothetical protein